MAPLKPCGGRHMHAACWLLAHISESPDVKKPPTKVAVKKKLVLDESLITVLLLLLPLLLLLFPVLLLGYERSALLLWSCEPVRKKEHQLQGVPKGWCRDGNGVA